MTELDSRLYEVTKNQPYPILFATVSGAHLYGFASDDSDWDLRGVHVLPVEHVVGLTAPEETLEVKSPVEGLDLDLVTHDIEKFMRLMLKRNGYVLEQLYSPLVISTTPEHQELKRIATGCVTQHHAHHYIGFARNQWELFLKEKPRRVKPLLYVYRVLLTGIHLMRTSRIEANIRRLNETFRLSYIDSLVEQKTTGVEKEVLRESDLSFFSGEYERLLQVLEEQRDNSHLPEESSARPALDSLLVSLRLQGLRES